MQGNIAREKGLQIADSLHQHGFDSVYFFSHSLGYTGSEGSADILYMEQQKLKVIHLRISYSRENASVSKHTAHSKRYRVAYQIFSSGAFMEPAYVASDTEAFMTHEGTFFVVTFQGDKIQSRWEFETLSRRERSHPWSQLTVALCRVFRRQFRG